jgi:hypothetical protein
MRDSNVGKREISDFAKINYVFQDWAWDQGEKFLTGNSEAQEIPAIDSLLQHLAIDSKQHIYSIALNFQ